MKTPLVIFISFIFHFTADGQNFREYTPDDDTLSGVVNLDCTSKYESHLFDSENMNYDDSLKCLKIQYIPLQNSNNVLCIERNFFGDTLGIGLKKEIIVKEEQSFFYIKKEDRLIPSYTTYGEKVNEWFYFYPNGQLKKRKEY